MQHRVIGNRAFTLVELAIVVLVLGVVVAGVVQMTNRYSAQRYDTQTAQEVKNVTSAVEAFLKNDATEITNNDNKTVTTDCGFLSSPDTDSLTESNPKQAWIPLNDASQAVIRSSCGALTGPKLISAGIKAYLPAGFSPTNYLIGFKRIGNIKTNTNSTTDKGIPNITAIVVRLRNSGDNLTDTRLARIASSIGSQGGFISTGSTSNLTGAFGGWTATAKDYGLEDAFTSYPPAGSVVAITTFSATNSVLNTNALSRVPTGNTEANTMRTSIDMGNASIDDTHAINNIAELNGVSEPINGPDALGDSGYDPKNTTVKLGARLDGKEQYVLNPNDSKVLAYTDRTFFKTNAAGIELGGFARRDRNFNHSSSEGTPANMPNTTAVVGQRCVYDGEKGYDEGVGGIVRNDTGPVTKINLKDTNSASEGYKVRDQVGIYQGAIDWTLNVGINLAQLDLYTGLGNYAYTYAPYYPGISGTGTNGTVLPQDYTKSLVNYLVPMGENVVQDENGKIHYRPGYIGRIVVGRTSFFTSRASILICDGKYWRSLNQVGILGPDNPAWAAATVGPSGKKVKTTYAPFENFNPNFGEVGDANDNSRTSPYLGSPTDRTSRQLFATLGLNTICGWNTINTHNPTYDGKTADNYQLACGTPEQVLGKRACFWSNGTGGKGNAHRYPIEGNPSINPGQIANIQFLVPATFDGFNSSFSDSAQHISLAVNQQICPSGYYVSGTAVNGLGDAPYLDLSSAVGGQDDSCGKNSGDDCTYIYCCPFDPDPSLNLYKPSDGVHSTPYYVEPSKNNIPYVPLK